MTNHNPFCISQQKKCVSRNSYSIYYSYLAIMSNKRMVGIMKIAICDDEKYIRDFIKDCITSELSDADILCFESAESFLKTNENADIMFLDIQMPGINGMELARRVRFRGSGI